MKKSLLIAFLMGLFATYTMAADQIIVDFEDGAADTVFNVTSGDFVAAIVDNPASDAVNGTSKALKVTPSGTWFESLYATPDFNFYTHPVLSFKIYALDTITLVARFDRNGAWEQSMLSSEFPLNGVVNMVIEGDKIGKWVEFSYDMSRWDNITSHDILKFIPIDNAQEFYIDEVKMIERDPVFDGNTIVPIFHDPVTAIKWVGNWASGKMNQIPYRFVKDGFSYDDSEYVFFSPNGYMAWPNDTIAGSSGGAAYILMGAGFDSVQYHDGGVKYLQNYSHTLTLPNIPTAGVGTMSLEFDMAVMGHAYANDMKPKVEVKFSDSTNWEPALTLENLPSADSTWTRVKATINGAGLFTTVRFTNEIAASVDSMQFWIDDISLLGTTTPTESIDPKGKDGLTVVSVGGTLELEINSLPEASSDAASWTLMSASDSAAATIENGVITGVAAEDSVFVIAQTADGTGIVDTIILKVQAEPILTTEVLVTSDVTEIAINGFVTFMAEVKPANATDKTVSWSVDKSNIASLIPTTTKFRGKADGMAEITATATDGGASGAKTIKVGTGVEVGIRNLSESQFKLFPNPVKDELTISNAASINSVTIYNLLGASVIQTVNSSETININTSGLSKGVYVVHIDSAEGIFVTKIQK